MLLNPEYGFIGPSHAINAQALFESNRWSRTLHEEFAQNMSKKTRCWRPKKSCIGLAFAKALEGDLPKIYCIIGKSSKEYYIYIFYIYIHTHTYKDTFPKFPEKCLPITVPIIYNWFFMAFHPGAPGTCTKRCPALPPWDPACPALARRSSIWFRTPAGMPQKFSWESLYSWVMIYKQAAWNMTQLSCALWGDKPVTNGILQLVNLNSWRVRESTRPKLCSTLQELENLPKPLTG